MHERDEVCLGAVYHGSIMYDPFYVSNSVVVGNFWRNGKTLSLAAGLLALGVTEYEYYFHLCYKGLVLANAFGH